MATKVPAGMIRKTGMFGVTEYAYKGVRVQQGCGRYSARYDFEVGNIRVKASTLIEAANQIDAIVTKAVA